MEDFDNRIWDYLYGDNWRHPMDFTTGINHLTPEENQETTGSASRKIKET